MGTYQISFDLDLKAPKKSKAGKIGILNFRAEVSTNQRHHSDLRHHRVAGANVEGVGEEKFGIS